MLYFTYAYSNPITGYVADCIVSLLVLRTCDASVTFPGEQDALILHIECKTVTVAERATTPPKLQNKKEGVDLLGQYFTTIYFCVCAEKEK